MSEVLYQLHVESKNLNAKNLNCNTISFFILVWHHNRLWKCCHLQAVITYPAYEQAIALPDLYDDVRIQVNILDCFILFCHYRGRKKNCLDPLNMAMSIKTKLEKPKPRWSKDRVKVSLLILICRFHFVHQFSFRFNASSCSKIIIKFSTMFYVTPVPNY